MGDCNVGWVHNEDLNGTESLLTTWHKDMFQLDDKVMGKGFIALLDQYIKSCFKCALINVYATCNLNDKVDSMGGLMNIIKEHQNFAWCVCGDFNVVRHASERKGTKEKGGQKNEITSFNNFIARNFLLEFSIVGMRFTWFKSNGTAKSRLDKVLVTEE